jgi:site-specific recombinase XerD
VTAEEVILAVTNDLAPGSRAVYSGSIREYLAWAEDQHFSGPYASVVAFKNHLSETVSLVTANRKLSAVKKFFQTAANMGLLTEAAYRSVTQVKGFKIQGQKFGRRLTHKEAIKLLLTPDANTFRGRRDRALLGVLLGCGLRRSEVSNLTWGHLVVRDDVLVIENLVGKHNRTRSVPVPKWVVALLDAYWTEARDPKARVFVRVNKYDNIMADKLDDHGIRYVVVEYTKKAGFANIAPHDLRRTFARLARENGAELDEIQNILGHQSVTTTQRYVDAVLDMGRAAEFVVFDLGGG